mmetsp:Transcript_76526/g.171623  ORF Transcript_76526/g.171623 Transcript_76526/m.171623 type:complete len:253 (+) Transcript_76526:187-945(+)
MGNWRMSFGSSTKWGSPRPQTAISSMETFATVESLPRRSGPSSSRSCACGRSLLSSSGATMRIGALTWTSIAAASMMRCLQSMAASMARVRSSMKNLAKSLPNCPWPLWSTIRSSWYTAAFLAAPWAAASCVCSRPAASAGRRCLAPRHVPLLPTSPTLMLFGRIRRTSSGWRLIRVGPAFRSSGRTSQLVSSPRRALALWCARTRCQPTTTASFCTTEVSYSRFSAPLIIAASQGIRAPCWCSALAVAARR